MDSRVGRSKRKKRVDRAWDIENAVAELTRRKGYATQTDVARRLGLSPSSHLLGIMKELALHDRIECEFVYNSKGNPVYKFRKFRTENPF